MSSTINQPNAKASFSLAEPEPAAVPNGKLTLETMHKNRSTWFCLAIISLIITGSSFLIMFVLTLGLLSKLTSSFLLSLFYAFMTVNRRQ